MDADSSFCKHCGAKRGEICNKSGEKKGKIVFIVIAIVLVLSIAVFFLGRAFGWFDNDTTVNDIKEVVSDKVTDVVIEKQPFNKIAKAVMNTVKAGSFTIQCDMGYQYYDGIYQIEINTDNGDFTYFSKKESGNWRFVDDSKYYYGSSYWYNRYIVDDQVTDSFESFNNFDKTELDQVILGNLNDKKWMVENWNYKEIKNDKTVTYEISTDAYDFADVMIDLFGNNLNGYFIDGTDIDDVLYDMRYYRDELKNTDLTISISVENNYVNKIHFEVDEEYGRFHDVTLNIFNIGTTRIKVEDVYDMMDSLNDYYYYYY